MNLEKHLRNIIGDMGFQLAQLNALVEAQAEEIKKLKAEEQSKPANGN